MDNTNSEIATLKVPGQFFARDHYGWVRNGRTAIPEVQFLHTTTRSTDLDIETEWIVDLVVPCN